MPFASTPAFARINRLFGPFPLGIFTDETGMAAAKTSCMRIDQRQPVTPWKAGLLTDEQVVSYRKAIEPLQQALAATKAARQRIFKWIKGSPSMMEA